jgi:hypothetical protein
VNPKGYCLASVVTSLVAIVVPVFQQLTKSDERTRTADLIVLYTPLTEILLSINGSDSLTCYVRERSSRKGNDMQLVPSLQELSLLSCQQAARRSCSGTHWRSWV